MVDISKIHYGLYPNYKQLTMAAMVFNCATYKFAARREEIHLGGHHRHQGWSENGSDRPEKMCFFDGECVVNNGFINIISVVT